MSLLSSQPPGRPGLQDQARGDDSLKRSWPSSPLRRRPRCPLAASTIPGFGDDQARGCPPLHEQMPLHRYAPVEQRSISRGSGWFEPKKLGGDTKLFGAHGNARVAPRLDWGWLVGGDDDLRFAWRLAHHGCRTGYADACEAIRMGVAKIRPTRSSSC